MATSDFNRTNLNHKHSGVIARALFLGVTGAVLALTGCAAELDPGEPATAGEREIVERSPEILGEIETADGVQLTFTAEYESEDGSGDPIVAITELAPMDAPSPLDRLRDRGATSLEAFLALAPEGTEPPALLRNAHAREAALRGRSSEVRKLSLDAVALPAPAKHASCNSYSAFIDAVDSMTGMTAVQTSSSTNTHSLTYQYAGGGSGNPMGFMCNAYSDRVDSKYAQFCHEILIQGSEFGLLFCEPEVIVPDGYRVERDWLGGPSSDRVVRAKKLENYTLTVTSYIAVGFRYWVPG